MANVDEKARPGLTVNSNGQVELVRSGLPVVDGDVVARNVTAKTATLTANHNLTLVESQLSTTGDLNLLARDTVRVRDSVANPFVAQAGGSLTIRGDKGVDILALNHPQTPFVSGGNLSLISDGIISGDAHFASGGNFSILNISGSGGNFVSLYDPIIKSNGDVAIGTYSGASLKIEAGGNITTDTITINSPDITAVGDPDSPMLTGGRALILRAGTPLVSPSNLLQPNSVGSSTVTYSPLSSEGSLTINGNIIGEPLTVILEANGGIGSISTKDINSTVFSGNGGDISITANSDITTGALGSFVDFRAPRTINNGGMISLMSKNGTINTTGKIGSFTPFGSSGDITLKAKGNITIANEIASRILDDDPKTEGGKAGKIQITSDTGNIKLNAEGALSSDLIKEITSSTPNGTGGNIELNALKGSITTTGWTIRTESKNGVAGNVALTSADDIRSGDIVASSKTDTQGFSTIKLKSLNGSVILDKVNLSTSNPDGYDFAGNIEISAGKDVNITGNRAFDTNGNETGDINLISNGYFGIVNIQAGSNVVITNSRLSATTPKKNYVNDSQQPRSRSGEIKVISTTGEINISNSSLSTTTGSSKADPGNILLTAENGKVLIQDNSKISNTIDMSSGGVGDNTSPEVNIQGNSVEILGNSFVDTRNNGFGKGADIAITATNGGSIKIQNSGLDAAASNSANGGNISLNTSNGGSIELENSTIFTDSFGSGKGGELNITAENGLIKLNSFIPPETGYFRGEATLVATVNKGNNGIPDASGRGGNINLQARNVVLENAAKIQTQTDGTPEPNNPDKNAQAGNITVNAQDSVSMSGGSELNAKTTGSANAGSVEIRANKLTIQGGSRATASSEGLGKAGDVFVGANSVLLQGTNPNTDFRKISDNNQTPKEGLLAEATNGGTAGTLIIFADDLRIENGASATVSSPSGKAGNLEILAKNIDLDNGALLATTGQPSEGANIFLLGKETMPESLKDFRANPPQSLKILRSLINQGNLSGKRLPGSPLDFLILRNGSRIAANANDMAKGGNVAINSQLLLALPPNKQGDNDISANAIGGSGGVVAIKAQPLGVYGIEYRKEPTQLNDITASSQTGSAGIVSLGLPDVDPRRGLLQLPENLGDSSRLITQSCPVGRTQAASRFIVTGRGGLPPSPSSALSTDALMGTTTNASPRETRLMQSSSSSSTLVEAKGVNIGPKGEIIFTANPSKPTYDNSWQRNRGCNVQ